jgi:hypothetical protein
MANKSQGSRSRNVTERPVKVGRPAQEMRPRGVSQIGESIGNKATEGGKVKGIPSEKIQGKSLPAGLSVPLGNAVALNVQGGGPGKGRDYVSKSGSNCTTAPSIPAFPDFHQQKANGRINPYQQGELRNVSSRDQV